MKGMLISIINKPTIVTYNKEKLVVPPYGVIKNVDENKLAKPLPAGIMFKKSEKDK